MLFLTPISTTVGWVLMSGLSAISMEMGKPKFFSVLNFKTSLTLMVSGVIRIVVVAIIVMKVQPWCGMEAA